MNSRRPILPLGNKAPYVLGVLALALLVYGLVRESDGLIVIGAVAAAALLIAYPLAEFLLGRAPDDDPDR